MSPASLHTGILFDFAHCSTTGLGNISLSPSLTQFFDAVGLHNHCRCHVSSRNVPMYYHVPSRNLKTLALISTPANVSLTQLVANKKASLEVTFLEMTRHHCGPQCSNGYGVISWRFTLLYNVEAGFFFICLVPQLETGTTMVPPPYCFFSIYSRFFRR